MMASLLKRKLIVLGLLAQYLDEEEDEELTKTKKRSCWMKHWNQKYCFNGHYEQVYMEWRLSDPERYRRTLR
jgi:hypothetical protein